MSQMLTLMTSFLLFFLLQTTYGVSSFSWFYMQSIQKKHPGDFRAEFQNKTKCCPYHLWTNFNIMSLEEERGRGELNVKRDKEHIQHTTKSQYLKTKNMLCIVSHSYVINDLFLCMLVVFCHCEINEQAISKSSLPSCQFMINIQCFHSTIKEHHALLAKLL